MTGALHDGQIVLRCPNCGATTAVPINGPWVDPFNEFLAGHRHVERLSIDPGELDGDF